MNKLILIILLIGAAIVALFFVYQIFSEQQPFSEPQSNGEYKGLNEENKGFLHVSGENIVDENGNKVFLRGVNLGSWLLIEIYYSKIACCEAHIQLLTETLNQLKDNAVKNRIVERLKKEAKDTEDVENIVKEELPEAEFQRLKEYYISRPIITDEKGVWDILSKRFGAEKTKALQDAYRSAWITEEDFKILKEMNVNFVRIPFFYMLLEDESNPYHYKENGFRYLDNAVKWCGEYNIYCLFDMHGAPGGQSHSHITGWANQGKLWSNKDFQKRTVELWKAIAQRYKDKSQVAGYDLLNEPWPPDNNALIGLYDEIYKAIRSVDRNHMIFMENVPGKYLEKMPKPEDMDWENIVYSPHFYGPYYDLGYTTDESTLNYFLLEQKRLGTPLYIGELGRFSLADTKKYYERFGSYDWHWTLWTYKMVSDDSTNWSLWALYQYRNNWKRPDLYNDSYEDILTKFKSLRTENFAVYEEYRNLVANYIF